MAAVAASYYTRRAGFDLISIHQFSSRSDTYEGAYRRLSADNGASWSEARLFLPVERRKDGVLRRMEKGGFLDPVTDRFINFHIEGLLPHDRPLEGVRAWGIRYRVSADGGRTWYADEPIVQGGGEYSPDHPLPGVWRGRNCAMIGDLTCLPLSLGDGSFLLPIQIFPIGPDGAYENPAGALTYTEAAFLRGRWGPNGRLEWEMSSRIRADPSRSTRGMIEPTIGRLADGRLIAVLRGSNEGMPAQFGAKWISYSEDQGRNWTNPRHWTYGNGEAFHSPSSCSQLLAHSSGRLYWIGNISRENPSGDGPRYPLVIGEVDLRSGLLRKESVATIDDRGEGDGERLSLSNFLAREDRAGADILVHLSRQGRRSTAAFRDWTADALLYRLSPAI